MGFVGVIKLSELEVVISIVIDPLLRDLSSSPKPGSLDNEVSFFSVNSEDSKGILSEVLEVSNETVFKVAGQIANFSFTLIEFIVGSPETPSFRIKGSPESLEGFSSIFSIDKVSFEVIKHKARLRKIIKWIFLLLLSSKDSLKINSFRFLLFLLSLLFLLGSGFLLGLFLGLVLSLLEDGEVGLELLLAKESFSEDLGENLQLHHSLEPRGQVRQL